MMDLRSCISRRQVASRLDSEALSGPKRGACPNKTQKISGACAPIKRFGFFVQAGDGCSEATAIGMDPSDLRIPPVIPCS